MSDATVEPEETAKKPSKMPLILGAVLALTGGGGGFFAASSGLLPFGGDKGATDESHAAADDHGSDAKADDHGSDHPDSHGEEPQFGRPVDLGDIAFVELPPLVVSMGPAAANAHLRFRATLEVPSAHAAEVAALQPRILDAMNGYLRALTPADIEAQSALLLIRAQLTRRIQLVLGKDRMNDLLVLEFVLN